MPKSADLTLIRYSEGQIERTVNELGGDPYVGAYVGFWYEE